MTGTALDIVTFLMGQDKSKVWDIQEHKEKKHRSTSQNSYYWKLLSQVAAKLRVTNNFMHNTLLREVAPPFIIDGQMARVTLPDTEEAENNVLEAMTYHLKPTAQVWMGSDKVLYRTYVMLKGSSAFDTKEFTVLLDRLIEIAKENDIETLPEDELAHMRELELQREAQKNKSNINTA